MFPEITAESLLTVVGNALFVAVVLQLLVKTPLSNAMGESRWYPVVLNVSAAILGILGAIASQAIPGVDYASAWQAVLTGLFGASVATYGYEGVHNVFKSVSSKQ